MKIDLAKFDFPVENRSPHHNPHQDIINSFIQKKHNFHEFVLHLNHCIKSNRFDDFINLFEWIEVLDEMDRILKVSISVLGFNNEILVASLLGEDYSICDEVKYISVSDSIDAVLSVLIFTEELLSQAHFKYIYNSIHRLEPLLSARNEEIVSRTLSVLAASASPIAFDVSLYSYKKEPFFSDKYVEVCKLLMCFLECRSEQEHTRNLSSEATKSNEKLAKIGHDVFFEFNCKPDIGSDKNSPSRMHISRICFSHDLISAENDLGIVFSRLIREYDVPKKYHFALLQRLRLQRSLGVVKEQSNYVLNRLLALRTLFCARANPEMLLLYIRNDPRPCA